MSRGLLPALAMAGCVMFPEGGEPIVRVGGEEFIQGDFDAFLESRTGFVASPGPAVLSALLDEFIREQLLVLGARDAGVTVSEVEVLTEVTALENAPGADAAAGPPAFGTEPGPPTQQAARLREDVRNRMLVKRFLEEVILRDLEVTAADLALELEASDPLYSRPATITLSEARFGTRSGAEQAAADLARDPEGAAVEFRSVGVFRDGELPDAVAAAVRELEVGGFTGVLGTPTGFRIFRLDERTEPGAVDPEDAAPVARRTILERRANTLMADLLGDLRNRHPVTVFSGRLSFPYLGREPDEGAN